MHDATNGMDRRQFLKIGALGLTVPILDGCGALVRTGVVAIGEDSRPRAIIRTCEWFGDEEMVLTFPPGWQVDMRRMAGHDAPELTDAQIRHALQNPVGSRRIAEIAEGRRTAVITFDDLTRPTPTARVVPFIIEELHAAGIRDEHIFFQCSPGTHSPLFQPHMVAKLGAEIVAKYPVWNHDPFHGVTPVGRTSRGTDVRLNSRFVGADVKITISGIKPHGMAGYGGGAKAIVPGVAWFNTTAHVHEVIESGAETAVAYLNNDCRLDMEEAARLVGLDVSINIVMNGNRQIAGLFAGDVVDAHRAAVKVAHAYYATQPARNADVVICNAYPQNMQASKELHWARESLRDGGSAVLIQDSPLGQQKIHFLGWKYNGGNRRRPQRLPVPQAGQVIVFGRYHSKYDELEYSPEVKFARSWDEVIHALTRVHGEGTIVAIYPTAPFQHPMLPLRM